MLCHRLSDDVMTGGRLYRGCALGGPVTSRSGGSGVLLAGFGMLLALSALRLGGAVFGDELFRLNRCCSGEIGCARPCGI